MVQRFTPKRLQIRRANGTQQTQQRGTFLRSQTKKAIETTEKKTLAKDFDTFFVESNFNSIEQVEKEINSIDPTVRKYMSFNIQSLKQKQLQNINNIQSSITKSRAKEIRYDDKGDKGREQGEIARQKGLSQGLTRLKQGELLTVDDITNFAAQLRSAARSKVKVKSSKLKAKESIVSQLKAGKGNITKINLSRGTVVVDGKTFNVGKENVKGLKLSSVTKANQETRLKELSKLIDTKVTIGDLRKKGYTSKEISALGTAQIQRKSQLKRLKEIGGFIPTKITIGQLKKKGFTNRDISALGSAQIEYINNRIPLTQSDVKELINKDLFKKNNI